MRKGQAEGIRSSNKTQTNIPSNHMGLINKNKHNEARDDTKQSNEEDHRSTRVHKKKQLNKERNQQENKKIHCRNGRTQEHSNE